MSENVKPIPQARVAGRAGDRTYVPDWDAGLNVAGEQPPQVVPVQQRAIDVAAPVAVEGITIKPAKLMEPAEARNTMARIIGDMLVWIDDFPYELNGEEAHVLYVFQALKARRQARVQASMHEQEIVPDLIDQTHFMPVLR